MNKENAYKILTTNPIECDDLVFEFLEPPLHSNQGEFQVYKRENENLGTIFGGHYLIDDSKGKMRVRIPYAREGMVILIKPSDKTEVFSNLLFIEFGEFLNLLNNGLIKVVRYAS
jgi:hypothetical protein